MGDTERVREPQLVETPNGTIEAYLEGPEAGVPLLFHHGTPSMGRPHAPLVDAARERGLRWVSTSRPGYDGSPRRPGRTVADCAADAAAVLDALGAPRCVTIGWSGGGPHALACAALLPDRVAGVAVLAGVAPADAEGLDWTEGMGAENVAELGAALEGPEALAPLLEQAAQMLAAIEADQLVDAFGDLVPDVDRAALSGPFAEWIAETTRAAVAQGIGGWLDDDMAFVRPWGFDLGAIAVPATIWQGDVDRMVPLAHGPWLADHIPTAELRVEPGHGHLSLVTRLGAILDELVASSGVHEA